MSDKGVGERQVEHFLPIVPDVCSLWVIEGVPVPLLIKIVSPDLPRCTWIRPMHQVLVHDLGDLDFGST